MPVAKAPAKPTIYTIAKAVGVSPAAVSLALSNQVGRVSAETSERIHQVASQLGYVPNLIGRRLRNQPGMRQIDLAIVTSFEAPLALVGEWVRHLHEATREWAAQRSAHVSIAIELFHAGRLRDMQALLDSNRFHGLLITNTHPDDDTFLETHTFPAPLVIIGRELKNHSCVSEAYGSIGRMAAEIFHTCGITRPAILFGRPLTGLAQSRLASFLQRGNELWGRPPEAIPCPDLSPGGTERLLDQRIHEHPAAPLPDGLFAVTDSLLQGAYRALHKASIPIPDQISILGIGDYETSNFYNPPLSTLAETHAAVRRAIPLLLDLIQPHQSARKHISIPPAPILRGSTKNEAHWREHFGAPA